jgi:hypothetical protein
VEQKRETAFRGHVEVPEPHCVWLCMMRRRVGYEGHGLPVKKRGQIHAMCV